MLREIKSEYRQQVSAECFLEGHLARFGAQFGQRLENQVDELCPICQSRIFRSQPVVDVELESHKIERYKIIR